MGTNELTNSVITCAQIIVAVFLFAGRLPRRRTTPGRVAGFLALFAAWSASTAYAISVVIAPNQPIQTTVTFATALLVSIALTVFVFDATVWAAAFCATAGYALQNLASGLGGSLGRLAPQIEQLPGLRLLWMVVPFLVVYGICYVVLISRINESGLELIQPQAMFLMVVLVILAVIAYDVVVKQLFELPGIPLHALVAIRLSHALLCTFILVIEYELLYNRRLQHEVSTISQIMENKREQYQLSKETVEAINLKCHDIRHQIRSLGNGSVTIDQKVIRKIVDEVNVYDSTVRTGNEPLDVILTEKSLLCNREGIMFSCIADGPCLNFMEPSDLYSLMGNALDNAMDAVRKIGSHEHRSISLVVRHIGNTAVVHVENYFTGTIEFHEGLPRTTKQDAKAHGYGIKSMRLIAQRYHGTMHTRIQGDVFHLNVIFPIPA